MHNKPYLGKPNPAFLQPARHAGLAAKQCTAGSTLSRVALQAAELMQHMAVNQRYHPATNPTPTGDSATFTAAEHTETTHAP